MHGQVNQEIGKRYSRAFGGTRDAKDRAAASESGIDSFGGWGLIFEVAESGVFGNIEQVKQVDIYEFYHYVAYTRTIGRYNARRAEG